MLKCQPTRFSVVIGLPGSTLPGPTIKPLNWVGWLFGNSSSSHSLLFCSLHYLGMYVEIQDNIFLIQVRIIRFWFSLFQNGTKWGKSGFFNIRYYSKKSQNLSHCIPTWPTQSWHFSSALNILFFVVLSPSILQLSHVWCMT